MFGFRGLFVVVCCTWAGGCTATRPTPIPDYANSAPVPIQQVTGSFAELPRVPGERVAKNPPVEATSTTTTQPSTNDTPRTLPPTVGPTVAESGYSLDSPLVSALRAYQNNQPERAQEYLRQFEVGNQELLRQLLPATVHASQVNFTKSSPTELGILAAQLEHPAQLLSARAPLSLTKYLFCTEVDGFGRYREAGSSFRPGELIHVYAELKNVPCVALTANDPNTRYVTELRTTLKLRDSTGKPLDILQENGDYGPARSDRRRDVTESPIRDYYIQFLFSVPKQLGKYTVHVEIVDPAKGSIVTATMPLRVGG